MYIPSCSSDILSFFPIEFTISGFNPPPKKSQPGQHQGRKSVVRLRAVGLQRCGWGDPETDERCCSCVEFLL